MRQTGRAASTAAVSSSSRQRVQDWQAAAALRGHNRRRAPGDITRHPSPSFVDKPNTADIIVDTLIACGATHAFGENLPPNCNVRSCR